MIVVLQPKEQGVCAQHEYINMKNKEQFYARLSEDQICYAGVGISGENIHQI